VECAVTADGQDQPAGGDPRIAGILVRLAELSEQVGTLRGILAGLAGSGEGSQGDGQRSSPGYEPAAAPRWWAVRGEEREKAVARLRAWATQVYLPGYGHVSARLGACWPEHDLCLYGLDLLCELHSVLYLRESRSAAIVSAQAEFQARILPALAEQLAVETTRCVHAGRGGG
jgi:hypothetical protein